MSAIIKINSNLVEKTINIIGEEPIYSKQVNKVNTLEYYFNKRFGSSYSERESKAIIISLKEFMEFNPTLVTLSLPFRVVNKKVLTDEVGIDNIENVNDYVIIYDKDSGWIGITKYKNVIIK